MSNDQPTRTAEQLRRRLERERTARLEAERLLEEKSDELYTALMQTQSSEALLRTALGSMYDGLLLTNQFHEVILANHRMDEVYPEHAGGFARGVRLEGGFDLMLEHPEYRAMLRERRADASFQVQLPGDRTVSIGVRFTPDGFIASTHRDVTEAVAADAERRRLIVELSRSQRMEVIGRMSGTIAHDFNNIIASIKGYAGFLEEDLAGDANLLDSARRIVAAAEKAERLIQQILEIGNQQQAPRHRVSLVPVLEDCLDLFVHTLPAGVGISFEPPEEPVWVEGNETRLGQLFMNLLTNARRAMTDRQGDISLRLDRFDGLDLQQARDDTPGCTMESACTAHSGQTVFSGPCVRVTLTDPGCGIAPEVMSRIFEMYFTTREAGTQGGIGMSSVADIVTDYGGGIRLTSCLNVGTSVEVVLPAAAALAQDRRAAVSAAEGSGTSADVLLIDDDEGVGGMIRQMLERAGISVEYRSSPETALELLLSDHRRWKVVVCDQIMPGLHGSDIYSRLRAAGIEIPFILCSAQVDPGSGDIHDWLEDDFVAKPVNREQLLAKVRRYV